MKDLSNVLSYNIASYLSEKTNKSGEEFEVLKYGVFVFIHMTIAAILTFILGVLTNTLFEILIISIMSGVSKRCCGGVHSSSPNRCIVTGLILSYTFAIIAKIMSGMDKEWVYMLEGLMLINSVLVIYKKCPVPSKNKPLKKEETRKRLRKKAFKIYYICTIVFLFSIIVNKFNLMFKLIDINSLASCMILGLYMQILSLTKLGSNFIIFLDKLLIKIKV